MLPTYDVFRVWDGKVFWVSSATTMAEAQATVNNLLDIKGEYMVFNQETQERINVKPELLPEKRTSRRVNRCSPPVFLSHCADLPKVGDHALIDFLASRSGRGQKWAEISPTTPRFN
jgi:hypothetical protein